MSCAAGELTPHFGFLEKAGAESGNGEAALSLAKARMAMIAAYSTKPARQADRFKENLYVARA